jgi:hypothetical protein
LGEGKSEDTTMWFESIEFLKISWLDLEVSLEGATLNIRAMAPEY